MRRQHHSDIDYRAGFVDQRMCMTSIFRLFKSESDFMFNLTLSFLYETPATLRGDLNFGILRRDGVYFPELFKKLGRLSQVVWSTKPTAFLPP